MGSIKAKFSAIEAFSQNCRSEYQIILNTAQEILSCVENYYKLVVREAECISRQVVRAERMSNDIEYKVKSYQAAMDEAEADQERCSREIDYIYANPITETTTDDDGNETTTSTIDYEALRAASRAREEAACAYSTYSQRRNEASWVLREAKSTLNDFIRTERAINLVAESIQADIYEIKKYIAAIADESDYNSQSLENVITSLSSYLASKAIFLPNGAHYEDFASATYSEGNVVSTQESSTGTGESTLISKMLENKDDTQNSASSDESHDDSTKAKLIDKVIKRQEAVHKLATFRNYDENKQRFIDANLEAYARLGFTEDNKLLFSRAMKRLVLDSSLLLRVGLNREGFTQRELFERIILDGEIKNQIQTGTSGVHLNSSERLEASKCLMGTEIIANGGDASNTYEKSGYLGDINEAMASVGGSDGAGFYGDYIIQLKKQTMMDRTTITVGDSLKLVSDGKAYGIPSKIRNPDCYCIDSAINESSNFKNVKNVADKIIECISSRQSAQAIANEMGVGYFELQYHGTITLDDIEAVAIPDTAVLSAQVENKLRNHGIKIIRY